MTDLFVSYKTEDRFSVGKLVFALENAGLSVWWDQKIPVGAPWEATIERELHRAKVCLVCWSPDAVGSENVKAEARWALKAGRLIQVFLQPCEPPIFFSEHQGLDLSGWLGSFDDHSFEALLAAISAVAAGENPAEGAGFKKARKRGRIRTKIVSAAVFGLGTLTFIASLGGARDTFCSVYSVSGICEETTESLSEHQVRAGLLAKLNGRWGLPERTASEFLEQRRPCQINIEFSVQQSDGQDLVRLVYENDSGQEFTSVGVVVDENATDNTLRTRALSPNHQAGAETLLHLGEPGRLILEPLGGAKTTYVRCDGPN